MGAECQRCGRLQSACDQDPCSLNPVTGHVRETTTLTDFLPCYPDGFMLADCSCGGGYMVPAGEDEYGALEAAHKQHIAEVA